MDKVEYTKEQVDIINLEIKVLELENRIDKLRKIIGILIMGGAIYYGWKVILLSYSWFLLFNQ